MFEFIFGHYSAISAFAMAWYDHDRRVFDFDKIGWFFTSIWRWKIWTNSYVRFLQDLCYSRLFFLLPSNSELKRMLSMMVSPPTPTTPHMKQIHLCCDYCLKFNIIGCLFPAGLAMNRCLRREIIPTIKCIKSSYYTQFNSTLAMSGVIHFIIHFHFTQYM